jgi:glutamyl-tRNA synthetase
VSVREYRERGYLPAALLNHLFRLGHAPARFDEAQLGVWQKSAVHQLTPQGARAWLAAVLPSGLEERAVADFIAAVLPNLVLPEDACPWLEVVFGGPPPLEAAAEEAVRSAGTGYFEAAAAAAARDGADLPAIAGAVRAATGRKGAALYMPLRAALTGRAHGPELAPLLKAMPAGQARVRLERFA